MRPPKTEKETTDLVSVFVRHLLDENVPLDMIGCGLVMNACLVALADHHDKAMFLGLVSHAWNVLEKRRATKSVPAPSPGRLWAQANGDQDRYIESMRAHGHLVPVAGHGIRVMDIAWQAFQAGVRAENGLGINERTQNERFTKWWALRGEQGCALPACERCGFDPSPQKPEPEGTKET